MNAGAPGRGICTVWAWHLHGQSEAGRGTVQLEEFEFLPARLYKGGHWLKERLLREKPRLAIEGSQGLGKARAEASQEREEPSKRAGRLEKF